MTTDIISSAAGILLSLLFSYVPGLATWYNTLTGEYKRLVMFGALLIVTGGVLAGQCISSTGWMCSQNALLDAARVFIMTLIANQSTDRLSPFVGEKKRSEQLSEL